VAAEQASWTLDELVRRVAVGLAGPAYRGAPNGRVRELPDRRVVRWYATTGLIDRPVMRGRTALYGTRHLLQVVAVKRRQAEGRSLAEIQAELAGATNETLRRVAAVSDELIAVDSVPAQELPEPPVAARPAQRSRFWADRPAAPEAAASDTGGGADAATALAAVSLPGGALLLLPGDHRGRPDEDDIREIRAAAAPLLELLAERGLLSGLPSLDERSPS
jgi:DNA-binding transcriptional MerR regulator